MSTPERPHRHAYAAQLLRDVGASEPRFMRAAPHPAAEWARSGLAHLCGDLLPLPLPGAAAGALDALRGFDEHGALDDLDGGALLAARAALNGPRAAHDARCRLWATADGWLALNLARDDDHALLPAWLERDIEAGDADALAATLRTRDTAAWIERAAWLGLAAAPMLPPRPAPWMQRHAGAPFGAPCPVQRRPRVVELASLWAGPLCGQLLHRLGAEVIKVESPARPDGARQGEVAFFDALNAGKHMLALDLHRDTGRAQLQQLIAGADIVIEGSRPRALRQLGIDAEALVATRRDLTWISLTGHGRAPPQDQRIAYGDDAGVAAGLSWVLHACTGRLDVVGDALPDPLTGLHAALAAWASWRARGSRLLGLSLVDVTRHAASFATPLHARALRARHAQWRAWLHDHALPVAAPQAMPVRGRARGLGADNAVLLRDPAGAC